MSTVYDWLTVGLFAGLIVLFLQRSSSEEPGDRLRDYLLAGCGLAVINQLGNEGMHLLAILALLGLLGFIHLTLRPLDELRNR